MDSFLFFNLFSLLPAAEPHSTRVHLCTQTGHRDVHHTASYSSLDYKCTCTKVSRIVGKTNKGPSTAAVRMRGKEGGRKRRRKKHILHTRIQCTLTITLLKRPGVKCLSIHVKGVSQITRTANDSPCLFFYFYFFWGGGGFFPSFGGGGGAKISVRKRHTCSVDSFDWLLDELKA